MLENDKRWKERFGGDLSNESWLDSSESTFSDLESMIFDDEKEDKVAWFPKWIMGLIGVLLIGTVMWFIGGASESDNLSSIQESVISISASEKLAEEAISNDAVEAEKVIDSPVETSNGDLQNGSYKNKSQKSIARKSTTAAKSQSSVREPFSASTTTTRNNSIIGTGVQQQSLVSVDQRTDSRNQKINIASAESNRASIELIQSIDLMTILSSSLAYDGERNIEIGDGFIPFEDSDQPQVLRNEFDFGVGYSIVSYNLNQNFRSAVDPADFTSSLGKGYYLTAGYRHYFNDIFSVSFGADIVTNELHSGHNSNQTFAGDQSEEELEIMMATPLGFMTGEVSVAYTGQEPESTSFVIDLENSHRYYNLDLQSTVGIQLYNSSKFRAGIDIGLGWQKIFNLENTMESYQVDEDVLSVREDAMVTQGQGTLNTSLIFSTIGARLDYVLTHKSSIGINYRLNSGIQQLQELNGLGTNIVKHKLGVNYRLRF